MRKGEIAGAKLSHPANEGSAMSFKTRGEAQKTSDGYTTVVRMQYFIYFTTYIHIQDIFYELQIHTYVYMHMRSGGQLMRLLNK